MFSIDRFESVSDNEPIQFWIDRLNHTERHKNDFMSDNEYQNCLEDIPNIISNPDYIAVHPKDKSLS